LTIGKKVSWKRREDLLVGHAIDITRFGAAEKLDVSIIGHAVNAASSKP
jgi:hypothetical protein